MHSSGTFVRLVALLATTCLAACGGGGSTTLPPGGEVGSVKSVATAKATFVFTIPKAPVHSSATNRSRKPLYLSALTASIQLGLTSASAGLPVPNDPSVINTPAGGGPCVASASSLTCTLTASLPVGTDALTIGSYDQPNGAAGGGNRISQQTTTVTIVQGAVNGPPAAGFAITLDANPGAIAVTPPSAGVSGSVGAGFTLGGASAVQFGVTISDADGTALTSNVIPGSPVLSASSTSAKFGVSVTQSPYALVITPAGSSGSGTITLRAAPATSTSGLGTGSTLSFSVSYAAQANLVAIAGSDSSGGNQIDLYTFDGTSFSSSPYGIVPNSALTPYGATSLAFDASNELYLFDDNNNAIVKIPGSQLNATSGQTKTAITDDIHAGNGLVSNFTVAADGTMAVANPFGSTDQIAAFAPGATTHSLGTTYAQVNGHYLRGDDAAILRTATGTVFGYGVVVVPDDGDAVGNTITAFFPAQISIVQPAATITGSTAITCSPGTVACDTYDITGLATETSQDVGLLWDTPDQQLLFVDADNGSIAQYAFSGGALGAATTVGSFTGRLVSGAPVAFAVSRNGFLAVAYADAGGNEFLKVWDNENPRQVVAKYNPLALGSGFSVAALAFLGDNSPVIAGGPNDNALFVYNVSTGAQTATVVGAGLQAGSATAGGVTGQSVSRRIAGRRRFGAPWRR
jgi:sugar lactone lactonase YvrE